MKHRIKQIVALMTCCLSLQSCFVAGAAAGAAAVAMVYDHRTFENMLKDNKLAYRIKSNLNEVQGLRDNSHIDVSVFNRIVLLTGETPYDYLRQQAVEIAESNPQVKKVYNQITIEGMTSSLTRTSDVWITTKIKTQFLATDDLKSGSIKVVTENGVVFLMGLVTEKQANIAVDIARQVSGVQRVVKIFQYKK